MTLPRPPARSRVHLLRYRPPTRSTPPPTPGPLSSVQSGPGLPPWLSCATVTQSRYRPFPVSSTPCGDVSHVGVLPPGPPRPAVVAVLDNPARSPDTLQGHLHRLLLSSHLDLCPPPPPRPYTVHPPVTVYSPPPSSSPDQGGGLLPDPSSSPPPFRTGWGRRNFEGPEGRT